MVEMNQSLRDIPNCYIENDNVAVPTTKHYLDGGLGHPGQGDEDVLLEVEAEARDGEEGDNEADSETDDQHSHALH